MNRARRDKIVALVHVDALRYDYVTPADAPFLHHLAAEGIQARVIPPFGFEPEAAYLAGLEPEEYDGGAHFVYSPGTTPFRLARLLGPLDSVSIYVQYPFRCAFEKWVAVRSRYPRVKAQPCIYQIPFRLLEYFDFGERYLPTDPAYLDGRPTLFNLLRQEGRSWWCHLAPKNRVDVKNVRLALQEIPRNLDFCFLMVGDLDAVGHTYGPGSAQQRDAMRRVDALLEELHAVLLARSSAVELIVFGDHGMVNVERTIDVERLLRLCTAKLGRDYVCFLDSTLARFWFTSVGARDEILGLLGADTGLELVTSKERDEYRIRFTSRKIGEEILWAQGGTMIFPNYWHRRTPKRGMHGYRASVIANHAAFVYHSTEQAYRTRIQAPIRMSDVFATAVAALELALPDAGKGVPVQHLAGREGMLT